LTFVDEEDYEKISQGDDISLNTVDLKEGEEYIIKNKTKDIEIKVKSPLFQYDLDSIKLGGTINRLKN